MLYKGRIEIVRDDEQFVDIQFQSVYKNQSFLSHAKDRLALAAKRTDLATYIEKYGYGFNSQILGYAKRNIWYTAENFRAPTGMFDLTLGFDQTDFEFQNLYFPFWLYRLDWGLGNSLSEISPKIEDLIFPRKVNRPKNESFCVFSSTREPGRNRLITLIEREFSITKFGSAFDNRVLSKIQSSKGFQFQVCPENSLTFGYVTEKLIESWYCENMPIWQGVHMKKFFNQESYIDVTGLSSSEIVEKIRAITLEEWIYRMEKPILNEAPSLEPLQNYLRKILESI